MLLSYGRAFAALELAASARELADSAERESHPAGTPPTWAASVMTFGMCQVEAYHSEEEASRAIIREILTAAAEAMVARGRFVLVIPGGRTFLRPSRLLTTRFAPESLLHWHVFMTDEHMKTVDGGLGPNAVAALREGGWARLLEETRMPQSPFHIAQVPEAGGSRALAQAARKYEEDYHAALAGTAGADLVIAGIGADCHVASILPGRAGWVNPLLGETRCFAEVGYPEEYELPVQKRISITFRGLNSARRVVLFCLGPGKASAVEHVLRARPNPRTTPASFALLRPSKLVCDLTCVSSVLPD